MTQPEIVHEPMRLLDDEDHTEVDYEALKALRAPFPPESVGKLPRLWCSACRKAPGKVCQDHERVSCDECKNRHSSATIHLDFVGHAAVTDRLLSVDPTWWWEPISAPVGGVMPIVEEGPRKVAVLWIKLHVAGMTRYGVGTAALGSEEREKILIGDAIRNAAMRFGVALDLWTKDDLESSMAADQVEAPEPKPAPEPEPEPGPAPEPPRSVDPETGEVVEPGLLVRLNRLKSGRKMAATARAIKEAGIGWPLDEDALTDEDRETVERLITEAEEAIR